MDFFGLAEEQKKSQFLFEKIFNLHFKKNFTLRQTQASKAVYTLDQLNKIKELNHLVMYLIFF